MSQRERVTIREVAARAGVSVMTVSRVLRHEDYVSDAVRSKVQAAIKALGYVPLPSARSLASSVPRAIGLLVPGKTASTDNKTGYEYLGALHLGALSACRERHYALVMVRGQHAHTVADELIELVRQRQVAGYVIPAPATETPGLMVTLREHGIPFAALSPRHPEEAPTWVGAEERLAVRALTHHLVQLGHRALAFAGGDASRAGTERLAGFGEALAEAGLGVDPQLICTNGFDFESGLEAGRRLLASSPRPTAIVGVNDDVAAGVLAIAHARRLAVPHELSVAGFDNSGLSRKTWPALSTIDLPVPAMAGLAARQLLASLDSGSEPVDAAIVLPCELRLRQSCARAP